MPVTLLVGRARLETRPVASAPCEAQTTIGIVLVACLAAKALTLVKAMMTSTLLRTRSAAISAARSGCAWLERCSKTAFWPSM